MSVSFDRRDRETVIRHLASALNGAVVDPSPGPHVHVAGLLPPQLYEDLLASIPPVSDFTVADRTKANFDPDKAPETAPELRATWKWFHDEIIDALLKPRLMELFGPWLASSYREAFGSELGDEALALKHHAVSGRLMLRRPGYRLQPHRDLKMAAMTGLVYFARPGDSPDYGTELYRVANDRPAPFMKTYYPEAHGAQAVLARTVPFNANSALVFMNVPGMAHGAQIPADAQQSERYAYQFYVGPTKSKLARLVRRLPPDAASAWSDLSDPDRQS
jgi:hypothetical protein